MIAPALFGLKFVGEKVLGAFAGKVADSVMTKLKGDPARKAFEKALAATIQRYSTTGNRFDVARPLLEKDGPLTQNDVATELAQILRFDREPSAELIGQRWKASLEDHTLAWRDFTAEARLLLDYLTDELRATDVFRPVFETKSLEAVADHTALTAGALAEMEAQLASLYELMNARFADLARTFTGATFNIRGQIRDFSRLITDKTRSFVGRQFVFDAVDRFTVDNPRGYFIVRGDPGIGKSALAAQMVKTNGYVHHFNIRPEGINKADFFLKNVCAQLIAAYDLKYDALPQEATQDAGFLSKLLGEVSDRLAGKKAVIVVDALDEVDNTGMSRGVNTLYLPVSLPEGVYIVVTARKDVLDQRQEPVNLRIDCEQETLYIEQNSSGNMADIREYVQQSSARLGIKAYIQAQGIDDELFVDHLVAKSQGNFMYLHYVLPEIEKGVYKDLSLDALPAGLRNYYEDHWRRMKGHDEDAWFKYKLPVVMALTVVKEAVSIDLLEDFSGVHERSRIRGVLQDWAQFLYVEKVQYEGGIQNRYRVYHASFHDFIEDKEEVVDERVSRKDAHRKIADNLWKDLFDDDQPGGSVQ